MRGDPPVGIGNGFTAEYRVRFDEAGPDGRIRTSGLLRFAQDVAWQHSDARGFDRAWYAARGLAWVVRGVELEVLRPIGVGLSLTVSTAVVAHRRIWARRLAEVRLPDGVLAARVVTDWVILDTRGRPVRIPIEIDAGFPNPPSDGDILKVEPARGAFEVSRSLRVRPQELDPMGHVNNATYLDWLEEALLARDGATSWLEEIPRTARLEYLASAAPGDALQVATSVDWGRWRADIRRGQDTLLRATGRVG
jgi:acyl-CoA thioesterase FadM